MKRNTEEYAAWLKSLKAGDEVCYDSGGFRRILWFTKVEKITKTGMIRTSSGELFDSRGRLRGATGYYRYLEPITPAVRENEARGKAINYLDSYSWKKLSTEDLLKVLDITKSYEEVNGG